MADKKIYRITEKAGVFLAGRRIGKARTIELTEEEARYELLNGTIADPDAEPRPAAKKGRSKPASDTPEAPSNGSAAEA